MAQLPRYRRPNVDMAQPRPVRRADLTESIARSNMIVRSLQQMETFVNTRLTEQRIQEGQRSILELDPTGVNEYLTQVSEKGGPSGTREKAAYAMANEIGANNVYGAALVEMERIINTAEQERIEHTLVTNQLQDVVDGFSASLSAFNPEVATNLRQRLDSLAADKNARYLNTYTNIEIHERVAEFASYNNAFIREFEIKIAQNGLTADVQEAVNGWKLAIQNNNNLQPQARQSMLNAVDNQIAQADIKYTIQGMPLQERQAYIDSLTTARVGSLNSLQIEGLQNTLTRENQANLSVLTTQYYAELQNELLYVQNNPGETMMPLDPERFALLSPPQQREIQSTVSVLSRVPNIMNMSDAQLDEELRISQESLQVRDENYDLRVNEHNALTTIINNIKNQRNADPVANAINRDRNVEETQNNLIDAIESGSQDIGQRLTLSIASLDAFYDSIDAPESQRKYFTNNFVNVIKSTLEDPATSLDQIKGIMGIFTSPENEDIQVRVLNQLEDLGMDIGYLRAMELPRDPNVLPNRADIQTSLIRAAQLDINNVPTFINTNDLKVRIEASQVVQDHLSAMQAGNELFDISSYNDLVTLAQKNAASKLIANFQAPIDEVIEQSISEVFFENIIEKAIIPLDMPLEPIATQNVFNYLKSESILNDIDFRHESMGYTEETSQEILRNNLQDRGIFITNETGDGVVLAFEQTSGSRTILPVERKMDPILSHHYMNIAEDKAVLNADGSLSTVYTRQVDINGRPTLIPSVWDGEILNEEEARSRAIASGIRWPTAETHEELRQYDIQLHENMIPIPREEAINILSQPQYIEYKFTEFPNLLPEAINYSYTVPYEFIDNSDFYNVP